MIDINPLRDPRFPEHRYPDFSGDHDYQTVPQSPPAAEEIISVKILKCGGSERHLFARPRDAIDVILVAVADGYPIEVTRLAATPHKSWRGHPGRTEANQ